MMGEAQTSYVMLPNTHCYSDVRGLLCEIPMQMGGCGLNSKRWSGTYTRTSQRTGFCKSTLKNRLDGYTKCGEAGSGRRDGPAHRGVIQGCGVLHLVCVRTCAG